MSIRSHTVRFVGCFLYCTGPHGLVQKSENNNLAFPVLIVKQSNQLKYIFFNPIQSNVLFYGKW